MSSYTNELSDDAVQAESSVVTSPKHGHKNHRLHVDFTPNPNRRHSRGHATRSNYSKEFDTRRVKDTRRRKSYGTRSDKGMAKATNKILHDGGSSNQVRQAVIEKQQSEFARQGRRLMDSRLVLRKRSRQVGAILHTNTGFRQAVKAFATSGALPAPGVYCVPATLPGVRQKVLDEFREACKSIKVKLTDIEGKRYERHLGVFKRTGRLMSFGYQPLGSVSSGLKTPECAASRVELAVKLNKNKPVLSARQLASLSQLLIRAGDVELNPGPSKHRPRPSRDNRPAPVLRIKVTPVAGEVIHKTSTLDANFQAKQEESAQVVGELMKTHQLTMSEAAVLADFCPRPGTTLDERVTNDFVRKVDVECEASTSGAILADDAAKLGDQSSDVSTEASPVQVSVKGKEYADSEDEPLGFIGPLPELPPRGNGANLVYSGPLNVNETSVSGPATWHETDSFVPPATRLLLDGHHPSNEDLRKGFKVAGRSMVVVSSSFTTIKAEHDLRLCSDLTVPRLDRPYIMGRVGLFYLKLGLVGSFCRSYHIWAFLKFLLLRVLLCPFLWKCAKTIMCIFSREKTKTYYYVPHLLSVVLSDTGNETSIDVLRANCSARMSRIPSFPLDDRSAVTLKRGTEKIAVACFGSLLNSTGPLTIRTDSAIQWSDPDCGGFQLESWEPTQRFMRVGTGRKKLASRCQNRKLSLPSFSSLYRETLEAVISGVLTLARYLITVLYLLIATTLRLCGARSPSVLLATSPLLFMALFHVFRTLSKTTWITAFLLWLSLRSKTGSQIRRTLKRAALNCARPMIRYAAEHLAADNEAT